MKYLMIFFTTFIFSCTDTQTNNISSKENQHNIEGEWGWSSEQCSTNPGKISFSLDEKIMYYDTEKGSYLGDKTKPINRLEYIITSKQNNVISTFIKGEDRLDREGEPVQWDLVIKSNDLFCWRRNDWKTHQCTKNMVRCSSLE